MADMILLGLAIICTAYFMVIVFYAGMGTSFAFIWLFFAALCVFLVYGKWYYRKNMDRIPQWVPVSIVTTCIAGVVIMSALCIMVFMGAAASEERDLDYVIVLGARVKEHTVSNSLKRDWIRPLNMQRKIRKPIWCCQEAKDRMNLYQKPRLCTSIWYTTA